MPARRLAGVLVVVLAVVGALLAGRVGGGRLQALGRLRVRGAVVLAASVLAAGLGEAGVADQRVGLAAAGALALAFLAMNRGVPGLGLFAAGLCLNAVAVLANDGAMPVSLTALGRIGSGNGGLLTDPVHVPADSHTRLALLTDRIAVPFPLGLGEVLSAGDVLVAAGAALVVYAGMRDRRRG